MYDIYDIVKVEKYSYNKGEYFVSICHMIFLSNNRDPKTSIVYHSALDTDDIIQLYVTLYP